MQSDHPVKKEINNNYTHYTDMHMLEQYLIIMKTIKRCSQIILDLLCKLLLLITCILKFFFNTGNLGFEVNKIGTCNYRYNVHNFFFQNNYVKLEIILILSYMYHTHIINC